MRPNRDTSGTIDGHSLMDIGRFVVPIGRRWPAFCTVSGPKDSSISFPRKAGVTALGRRSWLLYMTLIRSQWP